MISPGGAAGALRRAAAALMAGELVAFPTETVYGLGGDALQASAVDAIYDLKGRPRNHPVIVHVAADADLAQWASHVPSVAHELIERFWPGPLTLVLERAAHVPARVAAGAATIGLRSPRHPVAQALLREFVASGGRGIAAPSANRFGRVSPTTAQHVVDEFGPGLLVLDGGPCPIGIESTIVDLSRYRTLGAVLLRPGSIGAADLATVLGTEPRAPDLAAPRASGSLAAHYAPRTPLRLCTHEEVQAAAAGVAVWAFGAKPSGSAATWRVAPNDAAQYATALYATLRELDALAAAAIWLERPPENAAWTAIHDRLRRAQTGSGGVGTET